MPKWHVQQVNRNKKGPGKCRTLKTGNLPD